MKTTLLTNVYNENYLLPFWLYHHKYMFDQIIIVDYNSTDNSTEICKNICPDCKIIKTKNSCFDATKIDQEFMELENDIEGIKIVLNTTEFLFCKKNIKEYFLKENISYDILCFSPYSKNFIEVKNNFEFYSNLLNEDVLFHQDRLTRQLHNFSNGNYTIGRHSTLNPKIETKELFILWAGFYPLNEKTLNRKLQIQTKIPNSDIRKGFGKHHITDRNNILIKNKIKWETGEKIENILPELKFILQNKTYIVTGGCGFIGSHMVDKLISLNYNVIVLDNLLSGKKENLNEKAIFENIDINNFELLYSTIKKYKKIDGVFHFAAIARTPWCIDDPILCYKTNVMGTINVLELSRKLAIKRVVLSSSNVVYAFETPYRTSKETLERLALTYNKMYNMSVICLRYSNVYGKRQSETGPSPNVFAALRKSKKELGKLLITGDGNQTRNYTHVNDIIEGNLFSMYSDFKGTLDLCTGLSITLNYAAKFFDCPIEYVEERTGDIKHIIQDASDSLEILGWSAKVSLEDGIKDVLYN